MLILLISLVNVKCIEPDPCGIQLPQGLLNRMVSFAWAVYCGRKVGVIHLLNFFHFSVNDKDMKN